MDDTYDASWNEDSFWAKFKLLRASYRMLQDGPHVSGMTEPYSSHSSTLFSIAGTAAATIKRHMQTGRGKLRLPLDLVTWVPLGAWCYWRMLPTSDAALDMAYDGYGSPYDGLTADQCDIRQSILRRRGKWLEAEHCIEHGLGKNPKAHTRGLLLIGKAACLAKLHDPLDMSGKQREIARTLSEIAEEIRESNPQQAIRLYRGKAEIMARLDGPDAPAARDARASARVLALMVGAKDQLAKI